MKRRFVFVSAPAATEAIDSLRVSAGALSGPNQLPGGETWQPS